MFRGTVIFCPNIVRKNVLSREPPPLPICISENVALIKPHFFTLILGLHPTFAHELYSSASPSLHNFFHTHHPQPPASYAYTLMHANFESIQRSYIFPVYIEQLSRIFSQILIFLVRFSPFDGCERANQT